MISGGRIQFLDVALTFPEDVGISYATTLFWGGSSAYEADTSRLVASLLGRVDSFIDVGSNIGIYAVYAGVRFPNLPVYAFEPIPEIWQKNVALFNQQMDDLFTQVESEITKDRRTEKNLWYNNFMVIDDLIKKLGDVERVLPKDKRHHVADIIQKVRKLENEKLNSDPNWPNEP